MNKSQIFKRILWRDYEYYEDSDVQVQRFPILRFNISTIEHAKLEWTKFGRWEFVQIGWLGQRFKRFEDIFKNTLNKEDANNKVDCRYLSFVLVYVDCA